MRKYQKEHAQNFIKVLEQAHEEIRVNIDKKNYEPVLVTLVDCQEGAIALGNLIESCEGEGFITISFLEKYCEVVYSIYQGIESGEFVDSVKIDKQLRKALVLIENSVRNDIRVRKEMVFFPYKASMWDSLESIYLAAKEDPDCDAYCVPIPYFDKNSDGSLGAMHYEGRDYPDDIEVIDWQTYHLAERKPDAIFIHNPYDGWNYVTSVHPDYYSSNLKQYTDTLVYVPYFSTAGSMGEGQKLCPAYVYADYIVVQSEKFIDFYDERIDKNKFLPFGSPKFDKIIRMCENPPMPSDDWKEQMDGKKVYFYNTSLNGMLANTDAFLDKMQYVFDTFAGRSDECLLWRPHPLMESTLKRLRSGNLERYLKLKEYFIDNRLGIYDDTPSIEGAIAQSDVYIGDAGTSVTSLFGVVGKPLFILNNNIHALPKEDDWRGEIYNPTYNIYGDNRFHVTSNNQLWYSEKNDYHYEFYMNLSDKYIGGSYYMAAVEIDGYIYVIPRNAQHLLIVKDRQIVEKIEFDNPITVSGAFSQFWYTENYIFMMPNQYHSVVRYEIATKKVSYIRELRDFQIENIEGEWRCGASILLENQIVFASPSKSRLAFLDMNSLDIEYVDYATQSDLGSYMIIPHREELWLLPISGTTITRWNSVTGEVREYSDIPEGFRCYQYPMEIEVEKYPFGWGYFVQDEGKEKLLLSPAWGNMFVLLDAESGEMQEWLPPMELQYRSSNGYFPTAGVGGFLYDNYATINGKKYAFYYTAERKLYTFDDLPDTWEGIDVEFDREALTMYVPGYGKESEWLQYCCLENAFHTLQDLLDDTIKGNAYDRNEAICAFERINASTDGRCGKRIYDFVKAK